MLQKYEIDSSHPNVMKVECILASTGFNNNDHYFIPSILYKKKNTAIFQTVDWEHDTQNPIGCIANTRIENLYKKVQREDYGNIIDNDTEFDIGIDLILWKNYFSDKAEVAVCKKKYGSLSVSMEALVRDFAIAIEDKETRKVSIIELNDDTAFILNYMKSFGGDGYYDGHRLGMAFIDYDFSGVGLTETPANPRSVITGISDNNTQVASEIEKNIENNEKNNKKDEKNKENCVDTIREENLLANDQETNSLGEEKNMEAKEYEEKIAALEKQITEKDSALVEVKTELLEAKKMLDEKKTAMEEISQIKNEEIEGVKKELESKTEEYEQKIASVVKENEELKVKADELNSKMELENRKKMLAEIGHTIEDEKLAKWSKEVFEEIFAHLPVKTVAEETTEETENVEVEVASEEETEEENVELETASETVVENSDIDINKLANHMFASYVQKKTR